jgi:hypothetical protein
MRRLPGASSRLALACVLLHAAAAPRPACAQSVLQVRPLMAAAQFYDSNLFFTSMAPQSDFITRVSPGILSEYRSPRLALRGRYTLDVDRFANHPELSDADARQHGALDFSYHPTPRVALLADAEYSTTHAPSELNTQTGLSLSRARAERVAARSSLTRSLDPSTLGSVDYVFTQDRIEGGIEIFTHAATAGATRHLSLRDTVSADYQLHQYFFGTAAQTSHGLRLGWTRGITERSTFSIAAGPQMTNGSLTPELSASIRYQFIPGDVSFAYARSQTTALGLVGLADTQKVSATATWRPRRSLRVHVAPAFFHSVHSAVQADVYQLSLGVTRQIVPGLSLDTAMTADVQHGRLAADRAAETIPRQNVMISLVVEPGRSH